MEKLAVIICLRGKHWKKKWLEMMDLKMDSITQWCDVLEIKIRGMDKEIQSLEEFNLMFKRGLKISEEQIAVIITDNVSLRF